LPQRGQIVDSGAPDLAYRGTHDAKRNLAGTRDRVKFWNLPSFLAQMHDRALPLRPGAANAIGFVSKKESIKVFDGNPLDLSKARLA
jgi:hypothetical protein